MIDFSDRIDSLPVDQSPPSHAEISVVNTLFKQNKGLLDTVLLDAKDVVFMGILFAVISLPVTGGFIERFFPSTVESPYMMILVRVVLFMILYYILKNIYLVRK
jgi:hypothetical protein